MQWQICGGAAEMRRIPNTKDSWETGNQAGRSNDAKQTMAQEKRIWANSRAKGGGREVWYREVRKKCFTACNDTIIVCYKEKENSSLENAQEKMANKAYQIRQWIEKPRLNCSWFRRRKCPRENMTKNIMFDLRN